MPALTVRPPTLLRRLRAAVQLARGRTVQEVIADLFPTIRNAPAPRGTAEFLKAYSEMPWLRATVHRIGVGVASVEWQAMQVRRGGRVVPEPRIHRMGPLARRKFCEQLRKQGELEQLEGHPLLDLLHRPNPHMKGGTFRRVTENHIDLVGEAFWLIERDAMLGVPVGLWPLAPHWVGDVPSPRRPFFWLNLPSGGYQGEVPMTEIVWFCDPDPYQPYGRGAGTAKALTDELETDEYAAKHTKSWFYNSARPDLIVTVEGARDPELRRAEQQWLDRLQGFYRSFKPFFVSKKIEVDEIGQTFRDMQFTAIRQHERDTIVQVFGVPPEILGVLESSNRATIDAADYLFGKHVLVPRLELIRETIQTHLAPMFDERLIVEYESPVAEDRAFQLEAAKAQPAALKIDEWRALAGHEALEDGSGKGHIISIAVQVVDSLESLPPPLPPEPPAEPGEGDDEPEDPEAPDGGEQEPEEPAEGEEEEEGKRLPAPAVRGLLTAGKSAADDFRSLVQAVADRMEPRWRRTFARLVERAKDRLPLGAVENALTSRNAREVERLVEEAGLARELGEPQGIRALSLATVDAAARAAALELRQVGLDISWTEANPHAVQWAGNHSARLVTEVTERTREAIREVIERGFRQGIAPRDMARLIRDSIGLRSDQVASVARFRAGLEAEGVSGDALDRRTARYAEAQLRRRAVLIARTETIASANAGQQLLWQEGRRQGALRDDNARKVWITTPDDRLDAEVCEPMPEMAENQDVRIDGYFTTGTGQKVQAPPAHPNCRCAMGLKIVRRAARPRLPAGAGNGRR